MSKQITAVVGILFFAAMAVCTVLSVTIHRGNMPVVQLGLTYTDSFRYELENSGAAEMNGENGKISLRYSKEYIGGSSPFRGGDPVTLSFDGHDDIAGVIDLWIENDKDVDVTVRFTSADIRDGDIARVGFEKTSRDTGTVLPRSALYEDGEMAFVYLVREVQGAWGKEYVTVKSADVLLIARDKIALAAKPEEPVVIASDKALREGMNVKFH